MTRPKQRLGLNELRVQVDEAMQGIERLYGEKLKRTFDEMDGDLRVHTAKDNEGPRPYSLGTRFLPPEKRRKVNNDELPGALTTSFTTIADEWNNFGTYTVLSDAEVNDLLTEFNSLVDGDEAFKEGTAEFVTFRYLISILRKYVSKSMAVNYYTGSNWENDFGQAFTVESRLRILQHIRDKIVADLQTLSTKDENAISTFEHAVRWGIALNEAPGEPREIQLTAPSVLHLAIRHFVFKRPSGAY